MNCGKVCLLLVVFCVNTAPSNFVKDLEHVYCISDPCICEKRLSVIVSEKDCKFCTFWPSAQALPIRSLL
jgi:hypothetical protein